MECEEGEQVLTIIMIHLLHAEHRRLDARISVSLNPTFSLRSFTVLIFWSGFLDNINLNVCLFLVVYF